MNQKNDLNNIRIGMKAKVKVTQKLNVCFCQSATQWNFADCILMKVKSLGVNKLSKSIGVWMSCLF